MTPIPPKLAFCSYAAFSAWVDSVPVSGNTWGGDVCQVATGDVQALQSATAFRLGHLVEEHPRSQITVEGVLKQERGDGSLETVTVRLDYSASLPNTPEGNP